MSGSWRDAAMPVIAKVIADVGTEDPKRLKAALRAAWPFGPYGMHPLKVVKDRKSRPKTVEIPAAGQMDLFGEDE